jgi:hypothetical protein
MDDSPLSFALGSTEVGKADVLGAEGVSENDSCASTDSSGFTVLPTCGVCCWLKASKDAQSPPLTDGALLPCSKTGCGTVALTGCGGGCAFTGCCCGVQPACDGGADAAGSGSAPKSIKLTGLAVFICSEVPSEEPILLAMDVVLYSYETCKTNSYNFVSRSQIKNICTKE